MKVREATFEAVQRPLATRVKTNWKRVAWFRRTLLTSLVLIQTLVATSYMIAVLPYHGGNFVEMGIIAIFFVLFAWISVGFWIGMFGFIIRCFGRDRLSLLGRHTLTDLNSHPLSRTAVVMPIYHEPIPRTFGGIRAVYRSVEQTGRIDHFDFFILSDSRNPDVWLAEQAEWHQLCQAPPIRLSASSTIIYS